MRIERIDLDCMRYGRHLQQYRVNKFFKPFKTLVNSNHDRPYDTWDSKSINFTQDLLFPKRDLDFKRSTFLFLSFPFIKIKIKK